MAVIRPNAEPAATSVAVGDIFLIDGPTGVRALDAAKVVVRDASGNVALNSAAFGYTTTATAAGTTTLTAASTWGQYFTGATTQIVVLPVVSTLAALGHQFYIQNSSSGALTVNSSGGNLVVTIAAGASALISAILLTGTTAASWSAKYHAALVASGKSLTVSNSLTLAGTDGASLTLTGNLIVNNTIAMSAGVAGQVGVWNAGNLGGSATPTLGASGTLGSVTFGNATSGLVTLQPVAGALGTVTLSLPAATDTLVGKATTDILSNKTLATPTITGHPTIEGVTSTGAAGTGNLVFSISPTFTGAPVLAAPSATTLIVGSSATLPASPAPATVTANATTLPTPTTGTVLHVAGADSAVAGLLVDAFNNQPSLTFRTALTSAAAKSAVTSGTVLMNFGASGFGSTVYSGSKLQIVGKAAELWTDAAQGTSIQFNTTPNTTTTTALALFVDNSGGVSVGTTTTGGIGALLANTSIKSQGATAGIGYATGAGGTVSQVTSRTTGVTLNNVTGAITLFSQVNSAVSAATAQTFTLTNSAIAAADVVKVTQKSGTDKYMIFVTNTAAGSCQITTFTTGGTTNEAPVFSFAVIKGVIS